MQLKKPRCEFTNLRLVVRVKHFFTVPSDFHIDILLMDRCKLVFFVRGTECRNVLCHNLNDIIIKGNISNCTFMCIFILIHCTQVPNLYFLFLLFILGKQILGIYTLLPCHCIMRTATHNYLELNNQLNIQCKGISSRIFGHSDNWKISTILNIFKCPCFFLKSTSLPFVHFQNIYS